MSYSFSIDTLTKAGAKAKVAQELAKVMAAQAHHAQELPAVITAVHALLDTLRDDGGAAGPVYVSISGSVGTADWNDPAAPLSSAQVTINVSRG